VVVDDDRSILVEEIEVRSDNPPLQVLVVVLLYVIYIIPFILLVSAFPLDPPQRSGVSGRALENGAGAIPHHWMHVIFFVQAVLLPTTKRTMISTKQSLL
jgi:TRAP-type mannitol/chloroaromatic compound transport system permease small subunit